MQVKITLPTVMALVMIACCAHNAAALHEGGVGPCDACHTMHGPAAATGTALLKSVDQSSTCLACHEHAGDVGPTSFHVSTASVDMPLGSPPRQLAPGGDFGWLKKTYAWSSDPLTTGFSPGERHGHNIVAFDYQYAADITNLSAPGGTYPSATLACTSCHAPHGTYRRTIDGTVTTTGTPIAGSGSYASSMDPDASNSVGVYRLLAGKNYQLKYIPGTGPFANDPPAAVAPDAYNRSEAATRTRVAYGSGMSEWCGNCHTNMHNDAYPGPSNFRHRSGVDAKLGSVYAANYNAYVKAGDLSGTQSASYLSLVPFEEGSSNYATLKTRANSDGSYLYGPDDVNAQVMCLTCHRAHASGWDGAMRWNSETSYIVYGGFYSQEGQAYQPYGQGRTEAEALKAYYDIPASAFAANQDSLCNKCHVGTYP